MLVPELACGVGPSSLATTCQLVLSKLYPVSYGEQASGGGDGVIRLWGLEGEAAGRRSLRELCGLPARGFVNALCVAHSGRFLLAGMGQVLILPPRPNRQSPA